ncbi:MAG: CBS domain-containing protein [Rhodospirillales bacterium]|nr:CBS domain-containing protein [Rhodospirillales bacterium]
MDCKSVMAPMKVSLYADQTVGDVMDFMVEKHMGLVPVIHRDGAYAGMISGDHLMKYLLPRVLSTVGTGVRRASMQTASYLDESAIEIQERLEDLRRRTVGEVLETEGKTVAPDAPLINALMMIKGKQYVVPVVDDAGKLLGAVSFFSVLYALREEYDRETAERQKTAERAKREHKGEEHMERNP